MILYCLYMNLGLRTHAYLSDHVRDINYDICVRSKSRHNKFTKNSSDSNSATNLEPLAMHLLGLRLTPSRLMLLPQKRHILATHHARALATNVRHDLGDQLRHRAILPTSMAFGPQPRVKGAQPKFGARSRRAGGRYRADGGVHVAEVERCSHLGEASGSARARGRRRHGVLNGEGHDGP